MDVFFFLFRDGFVSLFLKDSLEGERAVLADVIPAKPLETYYLVGIGMAK